MADVAMYYPSTPPVFKSFAPEVVPGWLAMGWLLVDPNAPVPAPAGDPFPLYVTQAELEDFIPSLIANPASKVGAAGRAALGSKVQRAGLRLGGGGSMGSNNTVANLHGRIVTRFPVRARRARVHVWNRDVKANGAPTSGAIGYTGIYIGQAAVDPITGAPTNSFTAAPTKLSDAFTTSADGTTESVTPWVDIDLLPDRDYLLSLGFVVGVGQVHQRSQGFMSFISSTATEAQNGPASITPSGTMSTSSVFHDIWIEYEYDTGAAHGLVVGDSLTVGTASPLPYRDGYAMRAACELGFGVTVAAWHGTTLATDWYSSSGPKYPSIAAVTKPSFIDIGLGSNDFGNARTLAQVQADLGNLIGNLRAIHGGDVPVFVRTIMPRGFTGQPETDRVAYNAWLLDRPYGIAGVFDIAALVTDPAAPTALLAVYNSGDGTHLNKAGYQRISNACRPPTKYVPAFAA